MTAIQVTAFGGPEVLVAADVPLPEPAEGELLIDVTGAGVNYADTHQTEDSYLTATELPFVPGAEAVGVVVTGPRQGARVCGFASRGGAYRDRALVLEGLSFEVPDGVSDAAALSLLVQGLTAWHLLRTSAKLQPGESVVVHAAAGGVGSLAVQLARLWGAGRIIATASTPAKLDIASGLGADAGVVLHGDEPAVEVAAALRAANGDRHVDVVLEMTGGQVFDGSLAALARFGRLVTYGTASRVEPTPVQPQALVARSKSVVGFWLVDCLRQAETMVRGPLAELVGLVADGTLEPLPGQTYPLVDARRAHEDLLARRTTGKVVLDPRLPAGSPA